MSHFLRRKCTRLLVAMKVTTKVACFLVLLAVCCDANTTFNLRNCPRVEVMETFDMEKFAGVWYVQQRFNPICSCIKMVIEKNEDGEYTVTETGMPFGIDVGFIPPLRQSRKFSFPSNSTESIFRMKPSLLPLAPSTYGIVSTDYDNYAALWGCDSFLLGSVQNINILTREQEAKEDYIKKAKSSFEKTDVDLSKIGVVDQRRCRDPAKTDATEASLYSNMVVG